MRIVTRNEFAGSLTHTFQVAEDATMDRLLLDLAVEAFCHPVGQGLSIEGRVGDSTSEPELVEVGGFVKTVLSVLKHINNMRHRISRLSSYTAVNLIWPGIGKGHGLPRKWALG